MSPGALWHRVRGLTAPMSPNPALVAARRELPPTRREVAFPWYHWVPTLGVSTAPGGAEPRG
jgi:hypothetical protein